jgi:hypothetical protein
VIQVEGCGHEGLRALPETLSRRLNAYVRVRRGRFTEEYNLGLYREGDMILELKVFCGRGYYRGWIEVFNVNEKLFKDVEEELYRIAYDALKPGEPIYVDYSWDPETVKLIDMGAPPEVTRIGFKLLTSGFTWFKVWYYPEGFMEGSVKIQAEKALNEEAKIRHLESICGNLKSFTSTFTETPRAGEVRAALEMALKLRDELLGCP